MSRRQDLDKLYFCDGSLYISEINDLIQHRSFYHKKTMGFIVPVWKSYEIDTELDFFLVEQIYNKYINK
jgi:N-acylneuraminate cytidylyltransferase/CMP-N,N'-diacetyllegionaminic acid synthase